jgi:hypothetical protein
MAGTDYWVLVPTAAEQNAAGTVSGAFVVSVADGSAADAQLLGNYAGKVTIGGRSGYLRAGPFTTLAAADAYLKVGAQSTSTPIPGVDISPSGAVTTSNPLAGLAAIGQFFTSLGEANTWIRVAKVVVGGVMLIVGLVHITGAGGGLADAARKVPLPV